MVLTFAPESKHQQDFLCGAGCSELQLSVKAGSVRNEEDDGLRDGTGFLAGGATPPGMSASQAPEFLLARSQVETFGQDPSFGPPKWASPVNGMFSLVLLWMTDEIGWNPGLFETTSWFSLDIFLVDTRRHGCNLLQYIRPTKSQPIASSL